MAIQLAVIIINYKTPQLVIDCLVSLMPELSDLSSQVIVVDNHSADNSCELLNTWIENNHLLDQVKLISSPENTGFSGGNNLGIKAINADYYLLLNSDTLVRKKALSTLLKIAEQDSHAGLISPRLEWPNAIPQESCFTFHTPISEFILSANTGLITKALKAWNVPHVVSGEINYYDWTSFACVLIKSEVFKNIGLTDTGYFMYYEDVAFCYHAKKAGWKILNVPDAHIVHLRGGSSPVKSQAKLRKRLPRYYYESRTRYFYQTGGRLGLLMANLLWTMGYGIALIRQALSSSFRSTATACQWRDIWINFYSPLKPYLHPDYYDKT